MASVALEHSASQRVLKSKIFQGKKKLCEVEKEIRELVQERQ